MIFLVLSCDQSTQRTFPKSKIVMISTIQRNGIPTIIRTIPRMIPRVFFLVIDLTKRYTTQTISRIGNAKMILNSNPRLSIVFTKAFIFSLLILYSSKAILAKILFYYIPCAKKLRNQYQSRFEVNSTRLYENADDVYGTWCMKLRSLLLSTSTILPAAVVALPMSSFA